MIDTDGSNKEGRMSTRMWSGRVNHRLAICRSRWRATLPARSTTWSVTWSRNLREDSNQSPAQGLPTRRRACVRPVGCIVGFTCVNDQHPGDCRPSIHPGITRCALLPFKAWQTVVPVAA
jgi:hypothetical protein